MNQQQQEPPQQQPRRRPQHHMNEPGNDSSSSNATTPYRQTVHQHQPRRQQVPNSTNPMNQQRNNNGFQTPTRTHHDHGDNDCSSSGDNNDSNIYTQFQNFEQSLNAELQELQTILMKDASSERPPNNINHTHFHHDHAPLLVEENDNVDYSRGSSSRAPGMVAATPDTLALGLPTHTYTPATATTDADNSNHKDPSTMYTTPVATNRGGRKRIEIEQDMRELQRVLLFRENHGMEEETGGYENGSSDDISFSRQVSMEEKGLQQLLHDTTTEAEDVHSFGNSLTNSEWTLRTFMDYQRSMDASNLNGDECEPSSSKTERNETAGKRHLSMASNGGPSASVPKAKVPGRVETNGTSTDEGGVGGGGIVEADDYANHLLLEFDPTKRRKILPTLLLVGTALLLGVILLLATTTSPNQFKTLVNDFTWLGNNGKSSQGDVEDGAVGNAREEAQAQQEEEHWHPLFPHGKRTANVEVEVPTNPSAKPIFQDPRARSVQWEDIYEARNEHPTAQHQPQQQQQQQQHRRLQENDEAESEDDRPGANFDTQGFLNGDNVQELCPATHTLLSQSLILRSSYGNIFSVTTPDSPVRKKKTVRRTTKKKGGEEEGVYKQEGEQSTSVGGEEDGQYRRAQDDEEDKGDYATTGDYFDIDTEFESIYEGTGTETITIKTLSLRMADFRPEEETHFEVWLYTGSGDNIEYNENDLDDDPSNDNLVMPSKGEYQASRAKFNDWILISEGLERELLLDTDFFDHNGHVFNIGAGTTVGPLGRLDNFENMEDVNLAIKDWNDPLTTPRGGMEAVTAEGEKTNTYYFKIPEEKFMPLKLPKHNGKLTLFVTLDRVGLQYGYAAKQEFDRVDVTKHDYIDQTPSLDVLNGNVNLQMHVGEGVIFYPWMEEEFFYQTRRFLGKIWYDALIPCEYAPVTTILDATETPSVAPTPDNTMSPSMPPSLMPTENGTYVAADLLISVLIKDGPLPPMPSDVQAIFEDTVLDFVNDEFGDFCPLTWNEGATVAQQEVSAVGGLPSGASSTGRRKRNGDDEGVSATTERAPDSNGGGRYLRQLLEPIFSPPKKRRSRMLQAITLLDATTVFDAIYNSNSCPNKKPEELATLIEEFINNNEEELVGKLQAAHDYFKDAMGVSADLIVPVAIASETESEEDKNLAAIIGGIIAALLLCCCCCLLPLLVVRRRKRKESKENEIIGEDVEWAHPVGDDHFPPIGGYRGDEPMAGGDGRGDGYDDSRRRKRPDGSFPEDDETGPPIGLIPIPPGIRPPEDDTEMLHSHRFLDKEFPDKDGKRRPFGRPGRMPGEDEEGNPYGINIYPGGDYELEEGEDDPNNLRHIERQTENSEDSDWEPEHYEPDGGLHGYDRPQKASPAIKPAWQRLPGKGEKDGSPDKKLNIKQLVLQRKKDLETKKNAMRQVEQLQDGPPPIDEDQVFDKDEPETRIEDLMSRIKDLETDKKKKFQRPVKYAEESDYERWKRLNIDNAELSSSDDSDDEEDVDLVAARKKKRKKKKKGDDYMLKFDDLDAYNRALAVHQDAYIHKWVKVKVQKEDEEDEGAELDAIEMDAGESAEQGEEGEGDDGEFLGDLGEESDSDGDKKPSANRRAMLSKQQTEYIGDMEDDAEDEPKSDRRSMLSKQQTEYIGDMGNFGDDDNDEPAAPQSDPVKDEIVWLVGKVLPEQLDDVDALLGQFAGRETALRDTLRKKLPAEEQYSKPPAPDAPKPKSDKSRRKVGFGSDVAPAASASAPVDRRSQLSKEKTEYIGSISGGMDDEDDDNTPEDRRSLMSKQKTEYIGDLMDEEDDDTPEDRRSLMSKQKTEHIGDLMDEEGDDTPEDRRSLMSKQKTEHIGDLMDEEDEAPTDRRSRFSREKTEYIGDLGE